MKKNSSKYNSKKIILFLSAFILVCSTGLAIGVASRINNSIRISSDQKYDEIHEKIKRSKYLNSIFSKEEKSIFFDEINIKNNINNLLIDAISNTEKFKMNKYNKKNIILKTKYYITKSKNKMYVNSLYKTSLNSKENFINLCFEIN